MKSTLRDALAPRQGVAWLSPPAFPPIVNVEVFRGACPCNCRHCPVGLTEPSARASRYGVRGIELALWEKLLREIARHPPSAVRLHSVGDPILWEDLVQALAMAHRSSARSWIFTSAVTTDDDRLEALMRNASVVEVSVNSISSNDYRETKGVDAFELVRRNILFMSNASRRPGGARLIVSRTQSSDPAADDAFVRFWRSTGWVADAFVRSFHSYNGLLYGGVGCGSDENQHVPCLVHWARFNVSVEGLAVVCFNELFRERMNSGLVLGDLRRESIHDIWHGDALSRLRKAELTQDYHDLPFGEALPCPKCTACQPLGGTRQTSEHQLTALEREVR